MKKWLCLALLCLVLSGCSGNGEKNEYLIYSSTGKTQISQRSYLAENNKMIDNTIIDEIEKREDVELFPIQYGYYSYWGESLKDNSWKIEVDNILTLDSETPKADGESYYSNYYAIVPYIKEDTVKEFATHTFNGEIMDGAIPAYLPDHFIELFHLDINDEEYSKQIIWTTSTLIPISSNDKKYKMKEVQLKLQVVGFVNTYGYSTSSYIYTSNDSLNQLVNEHKETELPSLNYIAVMNESTRKKLEKKYPDLVIIKRTSRSEGYGGKIRGLCEEGCN